MQLVEKYPSLKETHCDLGKQNVGKTQCSQCCAWHFFCSNICDCRIDCVCGRHRHLQITKCHFWIIRVDPDMLFQLITKIIFEVFIMFQPYSNKYWNMIGILIIYTGIRMFPTCFSRSQQMENRKCCSTYLKSMNSVKFTRIGTLSNNSWQWDRWNATVAIY